MFERVLCSDVLPCLVCVCVCVCVCLCVCVCSSGKMDAVTALALAAVPPVLSYYQQNVTEAQAGNATQALRALDTLTDSTFGLLPYSPGTTHTHTHTHTHNAA